MSEDSQDRPDSPSVRFRFYSRLRDTGIALEETPPPEEAPAPAPRISRLVALAHRFQGMIDDGGIESMAEIARLGGVTRARMTQVMDLLLLAPDIQEELLFLPAAPGRDPIHLRQLLHVCRTPVWAEQRRRWRDLGVDGAQPADAPQCSDL